MNCYFHPEKQAVAQCRNCGKGICKDCVDRFGNADAKYAGLCKECALQAGMKCGDHPSKDALVYCEKCGKPICGDCSVYYAGCCSSCATAEFDAGLKEVSDVKSINKIQLIVDGVASAIGFVIGISIVVAGRDSGLWFLAWWFLGIGGNFRMALIKLPEKYRAVRDNGGSLLATLGGTLAFAIIALLIKSLAGPIIPAIRVFKCLREMKNCDAAIVAFTELNRRRGVYGAYAKYVEEHGDGGNLAELTAAGGALSGNEYAKALVNGENAAIFWMSIDGAAHDKGVVLPKKTPEGEKQ